MHSSYKEVITVTIKKLVVFLWYFHYEEKNMCKVCLSFLNFPILCLRPNKISPFSFQLMNTKEKTTLQQNLTFFSCREKGWEEYHAGCFMSQKYPPDYKGAEEKELSCIHATQPSLSTCHNDGGSGAERT